MPTERVPGIDPAPLTAWLDAHVDDLVAPLDFSLVAHGMSNMTYVVTDAVGHRWVLRRPPLGHVLASAHDMGREFRIVSALNGSPVPVPTAIGFCDDLDVNGAPFYVMDFIDGHILAERAHMEPFPTSARRTMTESLVDTLVTLHELEPADVGLGDLGRREDYVGRQLRRWKRQVEEGTDRDMSRLYALHARLEARKPDQQGSGIVHGDYRLDNCMIGHDHRVAAVLDWELCTLGDVLSDLGGMLMWWGATDARTDVMDDSPTLVEGCLTRPEVIERYAAASSRDLSALPFYVAFQFWRLAAINEGVRVRFVAGSMGKDIGDKLTTLEARIERTLDECEAALD